MKHLLTLLSSAIVLHVLFGKAGSGSGAGGGGGRGGGNVGDTRSPGVFSNRASAQEAGFVNGAIVSVSRRGQPVETYRIVSTANVGGGVTPILQRTNGNAFQRGTRSNPSLAAVLIGANLSNARVTVSRR